MAESGSTREAIISVEAALAIISSLSDEQTVPLTIETWEIPGEPVSLAVALDQAQFTPASIGDSWGYPWGTTWIRLRGAIPREWAGRAVEASIDLGYLSSSPGFQAEALVVSDDGRALRGLHPRQQRLPLTDFAIAEEPVQIILEAAANPESNPDLQHSGPRLDPTHTYRLARAELALPRTVARELAHDLDILRLLLLVSHQTAVSAGRIEQVVHACARAISLVSADANDATLEMAREILAPTLARPAIPGTPRVSLVGHAHLDTAWLWPLRETVRKAARSYSNVLALMDTDPDITFAGTQALHHQWIRDQHPDLWDRLVRRVQEDRWIPVGGMWVESDTLLASGESLARQLIHGQRFFAENLGREAKVGWLPDCFGYAPVLPQLLHQAGIESFLTQKLSWNDTNRFPHITFWWEGMDGSRVLCHFPTVDTYNTELNQTDLLKITRPASTGAPVTDSLAPFGFGDGGGGPTIEMLSIARRMRDIEGLPQAEHSDPNKFFERLQGGSYPTWRGDLYLETHRGVWTSQRNTKLGDARCDEALREAELWCATAATSQTLAYPYEILDQLWKRHLVMEFHDILPGSSIGRVHREAEAEHSDILRQSLSLRDSALASLGGSTMPEYVELLNTTENNLLDNGLLRARIDSSGRVSSLVDLSSGREIVPPGQPLGALLLYGDHPKAYDAWNLDQSYLTELVELPPATAVEAVIGGVRIKRSFGLSQVTQTWSLAVGQRHLDVDIAVDWYEDHRVLKLVYPIDIRPSHLKAGVQMGFLERPLHRNTSWEQARYEDWFQNFLHVSEGGVGIGIVTADCRGYDAVSTPRNGGQTTTHIGLTLLRSPTYPDPDCDRGHHEFRIALHVGADLESTTRAGLAARSALIPPAAKSGVTPVVSVSGTGIATTAVKLADDETGDLIVRIHEFQGARSTAQIQSQLPNLQWTECDLQERPISADARRQAGNNCILVRPFEILTLRLRPAHELID